MEESTSPISSVPEKVVWHATLLQKRILIYGGIISAVLLISVGITRYQMYTAYQRVADEAWRAQQTTQELQKKRDESGPTAGWQTYRNEEYGFEFKYPKHLTVNPGKSEFMPLNAFNKQPIITLEEAADPDAVFVDSIEIDFLSIDESSLIEKFADTRSMCERLKISELSCPYPKASKFGQNITYVWSGLDGPGFYVVAIPTGQSGFIAFGMYPKYQYIDQILSTFKFIK